MGPTVAERIRLRVDSFQSGRLAGHWGGRHILHGGVPDHGDVVLTSNDYLALWADPRITHALETALRAPTSGRLAASAFLRDDHPQVLLERALADHLRAPAGILCQSGWDANVGLLQSIADAETPVYIDQFAHMSFWHGARAAGAPIYSFRHNFPGHLREQIRAHGPGIIAVDAIYGNTGSRCPLTHMCDIADETDSVLVVDESHALGTDGPAGAGMVAALGLTDRVPYRIASLAKAFGGRAGFVGANSIDFVDYFKLESHPAVFSSTMLPYEIAGLAATLEMIRTDNWRRQRLRELSTMVRRALTALEFDLAGSASHIVALQAGPDLRAAAIRDFLEIRGIFGTLLCPPNTARNHTLIRFCLHAGLTDQAVDRIIDACTEVRTRFGAMPPVEPYPKPSAPPPRHAQTSATAG
ncbi:alpha-hydroxyketone-type quorum-sensing autoinducer synthase [Nocardia ninae]|uniref:8-amino-7-oxononanoate synthase n=1 Tax=Nocardia ninae NBRC 108245 TaxID=1210091 RepID=A0A511MT00_9NOCA|nr:alpha-hydroxyketone-type quorum-sensing autoinducer synthase [Nocardia ninae]GEM43166.1 CAI-1 autoinducer synthase [Nocardia ninae NBRC 108245]